MDNALLEVLVEHHNNGDHAQNGWKPHVYTAAIKNVSEKCSVEITKDNILARCKTFDKHYEIISKILAQSGFGWDWEKNNLSIDSEDVWAKYVESNKAAACYKNKVVKNWDAISLIYSKDHATGEGARTAVESSHELAAELGGDNGHEGSPTISSSHWGHESSKAKRHRTHDALCNFLREITTSFQASTKAVEPVVTQPTITSPEEIFEALQEIPDLAHEDILKAYPVLTSDERKFKSLMALPMDMRKDWLLMQI
ncbi:uncharacterized protein LOC133917289 [Phragmites australis]|uniref:uncharacterized protein LOC133917289 n=1 Tax=Phragmites australis TaxID=29695 RepID=UPI002D78EBBF|nr:uncharacterized protein LOC133917289 [Phragmites australis]